MALFTPCTPARGWCFGSRVGWTRASSWLAAPVVAAHLFGHRQQFHHEAQLGGVGHIAGIEPVDPLGGDAAAGDRPAEGQPGQDGDLVSRIGALHVGGGIGLGVAQPLGLGQHLGVGGPLVGHAAEDVVGGAVDDAAHPLDAVAPRATA